MGKIKYLPLGLFTFFSIKGLILGTNLEACLALIVTGAIAAFYEYKSQNKLIDEINIKLVEIKKVQEDSQKEHEALKSHVAGLKLSTQLRNTSKVI